MEGRWPAKFVALAQIMCSSALLPFIIDLMQQMEMSAVFGFGTFGRDFLWDTLRGHTGSFMMLHYLGQTVSPNNLGKVTIDIALLSEELQKRISYCKTVWGMDLSMNPCEN